MVGADKDENLDWIYWELAKNDPFDAYEVGVWMGPLLHPSPQCKALLKKHGVDNPDAPTCTSFWEEIEVLFEAAGVPWTDEPIFPIRTKWTLLQRAESIRQAVIRRKKDRLTRIERERSVEIARKEKIELLENRIFRRLEQKILGKKRSR